MHNKTRYNISLLTLEFRKEMMALAVMSQREIRAQRCPASLESYPYIHWNLSFALRQVPRSFQPSSSGGHEKLTACLCADERLRAQQCHSPLLLFFPSRSPDACQQHRGPRREPNISVSSARISLLERHRRRRVH